MLAGAGFRNTEAAEICRIGLHNYFAAALILPYGQFHRAAQELRQTLATQLSRMQFAISNDRLFLPITETSGELWMLENVDR